MLHVSAPLNVILANAFLQSAVMVKTLQLNGTAFLALFCSA